MKTAVIGFVICFVFASTGSAEKRCLVKYDSNDTSIKFDFEGLDPQQFRGDPGAQGKRGPAGPPGPIGGTENDTVLRQRYDARIVALEARLNALSDPGWFLATNGYRYKIIDRILTYAAAEVQCRELGGNLAAKGMRNQRIKYEILDAILTNDYDYGVWVGLDDLNKRNTWVWNDEVEAEGHYVDWEEREPNNFGGNEQCAHARSGDRKGKLNDVPCDLKKYPLCEKRI